MSENEVRNMARIPIDYELLAELLHFPEGTKIIGIFEDPYDLLVHKRASLLVEHPDLYKIRVGESVPVTTPTYRSHVDKNGNVIMVEFMGWK